jgi:peptide/nickel transport system permease protein
MKEFWSRFRRNRGAVLGLAILVIVTIVAVGAPLFYPHSPWQMVTRPFLPPFEEAIVPFGTDMLGRDIAAGIAHGARVSLLVGLISTIVACIVGIAFGAFAGYFGGFFDDALMRITEFFMTIPTFVFAIVLVAIFTPSIYSIVGQSPSSAGRRWRGWCAASSCRCASANTRKPPWCSASRICASSSCRSCPTPCRR